MKLENDMKTALSPTQFEQVYDMLLKGRPAKKVSQKIQDEWGLMLDRKPASFTVQLNTYRNKEMAKKVSQALLESGINTNTKKAMDALDVASELQDVTNLFKLRLTKMTNLMLEMPLPSSEMRSELEAFSRHIERTAKLHKDLGLIKGPPKDYLAMLEKGTKESEISFPMNADFMNNLNEIKGQYGETESPNPVSESQETIN